MKKIHFLEKKRQKKIESQTTYSSHSMAARMSLSLCNQLCYSSGGLLLSRVINVLAQSIVSIRSLYLVHVFSNLSKEPFLVAVCCISL